MKNKPIDKLLEKMTPKQGKFFALWLKSGNATQAALQSYETDDPKAASVIATENLAKLKNPVKTFLESNGISLGYLTTILFDATKAEKRDQFSGEMYKDHDIRLKAVDRLSRWLDVEPKEQDPNLKSKLTIEQFFTDEEKK